MHKVHDLAGVGDPVEPHVVAVADGEEHVHVIYGLMHAGRGFLEVRGTPRPEAARAGVVQKLPVSKQGLHDQAGQLFISL